MKKQYCSVSAVIFNSEKKILFVSKDGISDWQTVAGWLEKEDVIDGIKKEISEELGEIKYRIYDVIDTHSFRHKGKNLVSIWYLIKYTDGEIKTADDIRNYAFKWFSREEIKSLQITCPKQPEILDKAFYMIDIYEENPDLSFLKYN